MGFALGIFPILTVLGVWRLRKSNPSAPRLRGFPVTQIVYILAGVMILVLSFLERPTESSVAIMTVLVGIPAYFIFKKNSSGQASTE